MVKGNIEIIARGVLIHDGRVLLCQNRKRGHVFLPGGHVEFGEPAGIALLREMVEETGQCFALGPFLGACEASFNEEGRRHHEISLVYALLPKTIAAGRRLDRLESQESKLRFIWVPWRSVVRSNPVVKVLPQPILPIIALAGQLHQSRALKPHPLVRRPPRNNPRPPACPAIWITAWE